MTEAEKERIKLTASFLNIIAAGTVVTGGVAPLVGAVFGTSSVGLGVALVSWAICLGGGICLHFAGRFFLRRLDQ
ncbi:hypothetical protein [Jiella marina]|uniref:hypothetical protein n=1 Tax=Jiella sp. LLJ827 TaxID=2917712 RepID=UPI0021019DFB|nr:hypothetical protein [Jiella sp. LLJ827]MCQ0988906.1 hypothetical protein [Jiella sp. LLJ827]